MNSNTPRVLDALGPTQIILILEDAYSSFTLSHLKMKKRGYENMSPTLMRRETSTSQAKIQVSL